MTQEQEERLVSALESIASAFTDIAKCVDVRLGTADFGIHLCDLPGNSEENPLYTESMLDQGIKTREVK